MAQIGRPDKLVGLKNTIQIDIELGKDEIRKKLGSSRNCFEPLRIWVCLVNNLAGFVNIRQSNIEFTLSVASKLSPINIMPC